MEPDRSFDNPLARVAENHLEVLYQRCKGYTISAGKVSLRHSLWAGGTGSFSPPPFVRRRPVYNGRKPALSHQGLSKEMYRLFPPRQLVEENLPRPHRRQQDFGDGPLQAGDLARLVGHPVVGSRLAGF